MTRDTRAWRFLKGEYVMLTGYDDASTVLEMAELGLELRKVYN